MSWKSFLETLLTYLVISAFGMFTFFLGLRHNTQMPQLVMQVSECVAPDEEPAVTELQPL